MNTANLRRLQARSGLSTNALAEKAGLTQGHLWRIEHGHRGCNSETLRRIAAALASTLSQEVSTVLEELTAPVVAA